MTPIIVILSYNHPRLTERCIEGALPFAKKKLILVHNGSEAIHRQELQKKYPYLQHLVVEKNRGFSGGANAAIDAGFKESDWVIFLSNDCKMRNLPQIEGREDVLPKLIAPGVYLKRTGKLNSLGGMFHPGTGTLRHLEKIPFEAPPKPWLTYIPGSVFALNRQAWEKTGPFDEGLHTYWEDVDFSIRAERQGVKLDFQASWEVEHEGRGTSRGDPLYTIYYYHRNRRIISFRYARGFQRVQLIFFLAGTLFKQGFRLLIRKRFQDLKLFLIALLNLG